MTRQPHPNKLVEWLKAAAWTLGAWFLLTTFVVQAFRIPSASMEKTLLVGDVLFVNKFLFGAKLPIVDVRLPAIREPRQDDIVVFKSPIEDSMIVKRLIGIPGDTVEMQGGVLRRNGVALQEPYVQSTDPEWSADQGTRQMMREMQLPHYVGSDPERYLPDVHDWGPLQVPAESLWVMGDHRDQSRDSRFWGLVPRKNVRGMPILIYYSWDPSSYRPLPFFTATRWSRIFTVPK
ncbi:MAG: signal peptidase I [Gemmatimonadales bacterium]|nr:signal peptidase I [Gemmatimonadales bacterium]